MRIYEINTRVHCRSFDQITDDELIELARLGFDSVWLMGVWQISEAGRKISKIISQDFEGSPYALPSYSFSAELGGESGFASLSRRAHEAGLSVIVDFVSNHMALDCSWIDEDPDLFILSDPQLRAQSTGEFFLHDSGEVVAFGRDPYFPPWHDTAQLNYASEALRSRMVETLKAISRHADGVRCDMAMLVLRDYIRRQWFPLASDSWFDQRMPSEFWDRAISEVKAVNPDFAFIAEAYWDKEEYLLQLGFDLAYEKKLYDGLVARNAQQVADRLSRSPEALKRSLYFIENHDEPRAASAFGRAEQLAAAALILSAPGSSLIHEGQMEGKRERLPVQRIRPLGQEQPDMGLRAAYEQMLKATAAGLFKRGSFQMFDAGAYGVVAFARQDHERTAAYLGQISDAWHRFHSVPLSLNHPAWMIGSPQRLRVTSLLTRESTIVERSDGAYRFHVSQLSEDNETRFCLLEVSAG